MLAAIACQRESLGDPAVPSGTSAVSAADADGNAVVVVHSNSYPRFGSGIVVDGFDLVLNNRWARIHVGSRTSELPGGGATSGHHAPRMGGGRSRRPPGTHRRDAGRRQPAALNAQLVLADVFGGELRPGVLVTAPRWEWLPAGDGVVVEEDLGADAIDAVRPRDGRSSARGAVGVAVLPGAGRPRPGLAVEGAADPRTGGAAVAV